MNTSEVVYRVGTYEVVVERNDEKPNIISFKAGPSLSLWFVKHETWMVDITRSKLGMFFVWLLSTVEPHEHWAMSVQGALKSACAHADRLAGISEKSERVIKERVVEPMLQEIAIQELITGGG